MQKVKCVMGNADISAEWWVTCGMRNGKGVTYFALCVARHATIVDAQLMLEKDVMKSHKNFENFKVSDAVRVCL